MKAFRAEQEIVFVMLLPQGELSHRTGTPTNFPTPKQFHEALKIPKSTIPPLLPGEDPDKYVRRNWVHLAACAWKEYQDKGRGVVIIDVTPGANKPYDYVVQKTITKGATSNKSLVRVKTLIDTYDPSKELVLVGRFPQGTVTTVMRNDELSPPEIWKQLGIKRK